MGVPVGHGIKTKPASEIIRMLREIRIEKGLSIITLSVDCDMSETALSDYERGQREPSILTCERWARALGYELDLHKIEEKV